MSLETKVMEVMKEAMKAKDDKTLRSVRAIKAAIILAKTSEGAKGDITEDDEIKLLQKMVKQRRDSLEIFNTQNRPELAAKEQEEIDVISKFLPEQLEGDALKAALVKILADAGAAGPADMGKAMGAANKQLAGKADGKSISTFVKEILNGN